MAHPLQHCGFCTFSPRMGIGLFWYAHPERERVYERIFGDHAQVFQALEGESPSSVAYDTPSPKLLAFLKKQYGAL